MAANPYHYAGNDPVNAQDPFGLRPVTDDVVTRGLDSAGDWLGNNWEYLAGGALVVAGIALAATGVGGAPGVALMMAGGALMGAGGSMLIQKGTTGRVDSRRAAIDTAIGAVPLGGTARLIDGRPGSGKAPGRRVFKPPEMFYRAMSFAEHDGVLASRRISLRGESFVTQDIAYSRQLAARHPERYETFSSSTCGPAPGTPWWPPAAEEGKILDSAGYGHLPPSKGNRTSCT